MFQARSSTSRTADTILKTGSELIARGFTSVCVFVIGFGLGPLFFAPMSEGELV